MGTLVHQDPAHLRGPLGLALLPDGTLLSTNGDAVNSDSTQPSELIQFTTSGTFLGQLALASLEGGAFGLGFSVTGRKLTLDTVNDITNTLDVRVVSA